jgi:hypothetical protein
MMVMLNATLAIGASCVIMPRFDPELTLQLIEKHKVTDFFVVPPALLALSHHPKLDHYDHSSLRFIISGAAPLPQEVADLAAKRFGCTMMQAYGMTETSPLTNRNPIDAPKDGSVGPPVPDTLEKVVGLESGEELPLGEVGERRHRCTVAPGVGGDDQRIVCGGDEARRRGERRLVRRRHRGRHMPRRRIVSKTGQWRGQHLARQRQIDRPLGRAGGDRQGAVESEVDLAVVFSERRFRRLHFRRNRRQILLIRRCLLGRNRFLLLPHLHLLPLHQDQHDLKLFLTSHCATTWCRMARPE